jgi:hypothetical protein
MFGAFRAEIQEEGRYVVFPFPPTGVHAFTFWVETSSHGAISSDVCPHYNNVFIWRLFVIKPQDGKRICLLVPVPRERKGVL